MHVTEAPVFHPTHRDIGGSFEGYIESIEDTLAEVGVCVIVPPRGWKPRASGYSLKDLNLVVDKPIKQYVTGGRGIYQSVHIEQKTMSLEEFQQAANLPENSPSSRCPVGDQEALEREFWKNITHSPPLYGADCVGSLFDASLKQWNIRKLDTILSRTLESSGSYIPGVNTPYLYIGMWSSMFAWHTEDVDLYSINYLHFGEPKSWYVIPPSHRERFECVIKGLAPELHKRCPEFLRHKETLVTPQLLQQHNIPVVKMVQRPGQFVITYPGAYHAGFNHGFNCAESTNFATKRWINIGARARPCSCALDSVKIDMRIFGVEPVLPKHGRGALPLLVPPLLESEMDLEPVLASPSSEASSGADVSPRHKKRMTSSDISDSMGKVRKRLKSDLKVPEASPEPLSVTKAASKLSIRIRGLARLIKAALAAKQSESEFSLPAKRPRLKKIEQNEGVLIFGPARKKRKKEPLIEKGGNKSADGAEEKAKKGSNKNVKKTGERPVKKATMRTQRNNEGAKSKESKANKKATSSKEKKDQQATKAQRSKIGKALMSAEETAKVKVTRIKLKVAPKANSEVKVKKVKAQHPEDSDAEQALSSDYNPTKSKAGKHKSKAAKPKLLVKGGPKPKAGLLIKKGKSKAKSSSRSPEAGVIVRGAAEATQLPPVILRVPRALVEKVRAQMATMTDGSSPAIGTVDKQGAATALGNDKSPPSRGVKRRMRKVSQGGDEGAPDQWAQCEACDKWRRLPKSMAVDENAEFLCTMLPDVLCTTPEENFDEENEYHLTSKYEGAPQPCKDGVANQDSIGAPAVLLQALSAALLQQQSETRGLLACHESSVVSQVVNARCGGVEPIEQGMSAVAVRNVQ